MNFQQGIKRLQQRIIVLLLVFCCQKHILAQRKNDLYVIRKNIPQVTCLTKYDDRQNNCLSTIIRVYSRDKIQIIGEKEEEPNRYIVTVIRGRAGKYQPANVIACISKSDLEKFFERRILFEVGALTVPFKLRTNSIKIMAGNIYGPYIGLPISHGKFSSSLIAFGGTTNIIFNSLEEEIPETRWGVGFGGGYVFKFSKSFQVGAVVGWDIFEGVEDWSYGYQPWYSVNIGFNFIAPGENKIE
ncbi:MAG TPA: hypothetical protein DCE41_33785 [Cytophagales bacterium]|nr:hypothetical protein [Cytophagales bacterium]HAA21283.1 hypothetical protein [Cytophagales bacterium]HAP59406.1 hypothetical protein [Cytophagales bacterium]